jgi:hypothetical protein
MTSASSATQVDRNAITVAALGDDSGELEYWLARTPQERLQHIERLRQINYGYRTAGRLQRILEVVELASS